MGVCAILFGTPVVVVLDAIPVSVRAFNVGASTPLEDATRAAGMVFLRFPGAERMKAKKNNIEKQSETLKCATKS